MLPGLDGGKILLYAFILIFCAIGVGLLYGAVVAYEDGESTNAILMLVAALVFGGFGAGIFALMTATSRKQAREEALRSAHPGKPWMWRDDWASGRIRSTGKSAAWFLWGFTALWNLISTPLLFSLPEEILEKENYAALIGLLFPLVGIGLIVAAVRKTIQYYKYGECLFIMDHVPGILGGDVRGSILLPQGVQGADTLTLRLSCIHKVTQRSGKSSSTTEDVLWQTEQQGVRLGPSYEQGSQRVPVKMSIPYDSKPTERISENSSIDWKLEANAAVPGVDFATSFEIPVFKTQDSSPGITEEQLRSEVVAAGAPVITSVDATGVTIVPSTLGGTEFIIKPHYRSSDILPGVGVALFLGGIVALLVYAGAPFIFPFVFGLFALLFILIMIFMSFGESRIVVEEGHVSVRNTLFGIMTGRRIPCARITKIGVKASPQAGRRGYFSITFTEEGEKTISPFQFLREQRHADWLAEEVRKAMMPWRGGQQ